MSNQSYCDLWSSRILLGNISEQELLENVCNEIIANIDFTKPFSDFQENINVFDFGENLQKFRDTVVISAFEAYLQSINLSYNDFDGYWLRSWITGMSSGYYIPYHNHSGASLSAVFYLLVDNSDTSSGGELVFCDPRTNANRGYLGQFKTMFEEKRVKPVTGDYAIFPSFVYHYSTPYSGKIRLAMPVDLYLKN